MTVFTQTIPGGSSGGAADDFQSGYYQINAGQTVTIEARKQMVTFGPLLNEGVLNIDGQFILEV